ncbi:hypothetical protein ACFP65_00205 [Marinilactibacillus sp. GCM10026970]|uniref:hypothetical protein n=1 Tax=Marinilactibacillus sp. GCM10026970 TaxID=3252642 RepID=UPI003613804B
MIILFIINFGYELFFDSIILDIVTLLISLVVPFFVSITYLKVVRSERLSFEKDVTQEVRHSGIRYFIGAGLSSIYIILWSILFLIPGYIKQLSYSMTPYIMKDNEEITGNDAIDYSRSMMNGHKKSLFFLFWSYYLIPFIILVVALALTFVPLVTLILEPQGMIEFSANIIYSLGGALLLYLVFFILYIRNITRYNVAVALFYEELKISLSSSDSTSSEWDEQF